MCVRSQWVGASLLASGWLLNTTDWRPPEYQHCQVGFPLKKQRYEIADFQRPFKFARRNYIFLQDIKVKYTLTIFWKSILFAFYQQKMNKNSTWQYCCRAKSVKFFDESLNKRDFLKFFNLYLWYHYFTPSLCSFCVNEVILYLPC